MAAKAVENAFMRLDDRLEILTVNALNYISPILEKVILKTYMGVVKNNPDLWEFLYDNSKIKNRLSKIREFAHRLNSSKLVDLVKEFKPDAIICTQAYPCGVLSQLKESEGLDAPLIAVVTDFVVHSYWMLDTVDSFIVPTEASLERLEASGISRERIHVLGIPVDPSFNRILDRRLLRKWYGIEEKRSVVLIMGGGQGLLPIRDIVMSLQEVTKPIHIIAVTGRNHNLKSKLESIQKKCRTPLTITGYVNEIDALMEVSDLLISKPGGLTSAEALSKRLPMLIYKPLPGQESKNSEYLVKQNAAVKIEHIDEIPRVVQKVFSDGKLLTSLHEHIDRIRKPHAAMDIARKVLELAHVEVPAL